MWSGIVCRPSALLVGRGGRHADQAVPAVPVASNAFGGGGSLAERAYRRTFRPRAVQQPPHTSFPLQLLVRVLWTR